MLYEAKGYPPAATEPGSMTEAQRHEEAQKYFDKLYVRSQPAFESAKSNFEKEKIHGKKALDSTAFLAPQATEHIYHCLLLTLILYSPKLHNLHDLRRLADAVAAELITIWPKNQRAYKRNFELLLRA